MNLIENAAIIAAVVFVILFATQSASGQNVHRSGKTTVAHALSSFRGCPAGMLQKWSLFRPGAS